MSGDRAFFDRKTRINVLLDELKLTKGERDRAEAALAHLREQIREKIEEWRWDYYAGPLAEILEELITEKPGQ